MLTMRPKGSNCRGMMRSLQRKQWNCLYSNETELEHPLPVPRTNRLRGRVRSRGVRLRIAGGEGNREITELRQYLRHGSLDIYQPDVVWSTGILRARQLASEVQASGAVYSPHTWGDGLVLLANLHVAAAVSQAPFIEYPFDPPGWTPERRDFILPAPIQARNGYVTLPDSPGLGLKIDWKELEKLEI